MEKWSNVLFTGPNLNSSAIALKIALKAALVPIRFYSRHFDSHTTT